MATATFHLLIKDYDYLAPLACGDVQSEGFDLRLERDTPHALDRTLNDPSIGAGELSFARHLIRLSNDDHSFIGLPFFAYRAFRQRCFFVRRESGLHDLKQLAGKRIGCNEWPASGNVWTRGLLREQAVALDGVRWTIGPVDDPDAVRRPQGQLPPYARELPSGQTLLQLLLHGEIDALICPRPPRGFYESDSPVVRLLEDYRSAEKAWYRRTGIYPPHHIVGIRRSVIESRPEIVRGLYEVLERSRLMWQERRKAWAESSPWFLTEIEDATALMGEDWQPNGTEANRTSIRAFCDELWAQGFLKRPLEAESVFAEFDSSVSAGNILKEDGR